MKRDMDLIRKTLLKLEEHPSGFAPEHLDCEGFTPNQIGFHVKIMAQADLIDAVDATVLSDTSPNWMPTSITWKGYEFLDAARDPTIWAKAKGRAAALGGVGLAVLQELLISYARKQVGLND